MQRKILEKEIQLAICDHLALKKYFFWRQNTSPIFADGKFRSMPKYSMNGVPDIILVHKGKFIGLEVKRPKCKPSEAQLAFMKGLTIAGGDYHIVTSIDDVKKIGL